MNPDSLVGHIGNAQQLLKMPYAVFPDGPVYTQTAIDQISDHLKTAQDILKKYRALLREMRTDELGRRLPK